MVEKIAARKFAKDYLSDLHDSVFDSLMDAGHFYDPLVKEVRTMCQGIRRIKPFLRSYLSMHLSLSAYTHRSIHAYVPVRFPFSLVPFCLSSYIVVYIFVYGRVED